MESYKLQIRCTTESLLE